MIGYRNWCMSLAAFHGNFTAADVGMIVPSEFVLNLPGKGKLFHGHY